MGIMIFVGVALILILLFTLLLLPAVSKKKIGRTSSHRRIFSPNEVNDALLDGRLKEIGEIGDIRENNPL